MKRLRPALALAAAAALVLTGCASGATDAGSGDTGGAAADGFPVTIAHAFGETTIDAKPERVATVAWANHEVPIALGVVPVIMEKATWGDDDGDGVLPWVEEKLEELGAETPALYDGGDGIDYDAINDAAPDVILASYSGLTQEEYDTLSKIAPVVAYPEVAWGTSYEDMIRMNSEAIGLADEGEALIEDLHADVDSAIAAHSGIEDARILFAYMDPADFSQIGFYTVHDTRPGFFDGLGFPQPSVVTDESDKTDAFYVTVSAEEADRFADVDVFVTYGDPDGELIAAMQADPLLSKIPAIAEGRIAILQDATPLAASANPSPLSIPWGIGDYFGLIAAARG